MDYNEFLQKRKLFYLEHDTCIIKFAPGKYMNSTHAEWFTEYNIPYLHTVLGYYWEDEEDSHVMLYWNDYSVPNVISAIFPYLFTYFPKIQWIGLGCICDKEKTKWEPHFKVYNNA